MDLYLLGAGFSADAGVPTMKSFMPAVEEYAQVLDHSPFQPALMRAVDYAEAMGTQNIEDLLATAINNPVFFDLVWSFGLTINHCSRQFLAACQAGENIFWYEQFTQIICTSGAHVLTFNYDLILEDLLWWRSSCREDYGLTFSAELPRPCSVQEEKCVPLYKLHGSISWLWCMHCSYTINHYRHFLGNTYHPKPCPCCGQSLIPLLIPPTFHKATELALPLQNLWTEADRLFSQAERIIVGGISFADSDTDFRDRFLQKVAANSSLKEVVIVNRDKKRGETIGQLLPAETPWRRIKSFADWRGEGAL